MSLECIAKVGFGVPAVCSWSGCAPGRCCCPVASTRQAVSLQCEGWDSKGSVLLFCQLPPAFSSCPIPQEPSWLGRLLPWGCACAFMHCRGSWKRQSRVFIEEMSSDLPAGFTAFHGLKGWEVFLLPATQSILSLGCSQHGLSRVPVWVCPALAVLPVTLRSRAGWELVPAALATLAHSCSAKLVLLEAGIASLHGEKDPWWVREVASGSSLF